MNKLIFLGRVVVGFCAAMPLVGVTAMAQERFVEPAAAISARVGKEVLDVHAKMMAAANRLDADAFFAFILDTEKGLIVQNGVLFKNRAEALAVVKRGFQGIAKLDRSFENPQVTVVSADCALLTAEGTTAATLDDGRMLNSRFAVSLVFVRQGGEWKLLHGHYSMPAARP